jgi:Squalene-hopene cyclase C-terminal domain
VPVIRPPSPPAVPAIPPGHPESPTAGPPRSGARRLRARLLGAGTAVALACGLLATAPATAAPPSDEAVDAAGWIASQVRHHRIHNAEFDVDDWGLTVDAYWALVASRRHAGTAAGMVRAVSRHAQAYVQFDGSYFAGATAKVLLARRVGRLDTTVRIDGRAVNLRGRLLTMVTPTGRVRDEGETDFSSTLTQSLAVLAFARSGRAPQPVVDYLLRQRCPQGYFRERLGARTCGQAGADPYVDSTALALQALVAARADGADLPRAAVRETARWLISVQNGDGSWSAPGSDRDVNTNTTGLAAQALGAVRATAATRQSIDAAAGYVARLQITAARAGSGPAADEVGAIARTAPELATALEDGITRSTRDAFRRATAQAQFALVPVPLGTLTARRP